MPRGVYTRTKKMNRPKKPIGTCVVSDCDVRCRSSGCQYCETHYYRIRRNGTLELKPRLERIPTNTPEKVFAERRRPKWYVSLAMPGHPLAGRDGHIYQHRYVYHAFHGDGPFKCHWCGIDITWRILHIDHLNDVKCDNRIENLVASCGPCNVRRAAPKSKAKRDETVGRFISAQGKRLTIADWSRETGLSVSAINWRIARGWPEERLFVPRGKFGPQRRVK